MSGLPSISCADTGRLRAVDPERTYGVFFSYMSTPLIRRPLRYVYSNLALTLIIINVAVYFLNTAIPQTRILFAMVPGLIVGRGYVWQFLTYMFTHANMSHILFNMLGLFFFGVQVERRMGSYEFLLFYLVTGVLAGIFSFLFFYFTGTVTILLGASGAVFAFCWPSPSTTPTPGSL